VNRPACGRRRQKLPQLLEHQGEHLIQPSAQVLEFLVGAVLSFKPGQCFPKLRDFAQQVQAVNRPPKDARVRREQRVSGEQVPPGALPLVALPVLILAIAEP
jgi:hypothetical protein